MNLLSVLIYSSRQIYLISSYKQHKDNWKRKVKRFFKTKSPKKLTKEQKREIKNYYKRYNLNNVSTLWHQHYLNTTGEFHAEYIPETLYYTKIEPVLVPDIYVPGIEDKNLQENLFPNIRQPKTVLKNIGGTYVVCGKAVDIARAIEVCDNRKDLVIKPTVVTGGGLNVNRFDSANGQTTYGAKSIKQLFKDYKRDFIVQEVVKQHPSMAVLNPTSLNTFRIMTFIRNGKVELLSAYVRFGRLGCFKDNASLGGLSCGVSYSGKMNKYGYQNRTGTQFTKTDGGLAFEDIHLPLAHKVLDKAKELHVSIPMIRLISWDLVLDSEGEVVLIEINAKGQDINNLQLNCGPALTALLEDRFLD